MRKTADIRFALACLFWSVRLRKAISNDAATMDMPIIREGTFLATIRMTRLVLLPKKTGSNSGLLSMYVVSKTMDRGPSMAVPSRVTRLYRPPSNEGGFCPPWLSMEYTRFPPW